MKFNDIYKIKKTKVGNGELILVTAPNQYHLTSLFVRMEEFYESPFKEINGHYFTLEEFMDIYAESKGGVFSYFTDWNGFNIPGSSILKFINMFPPRYYLNEKEKWLINQLPDHDNFYIIGVHEQKFSTLDHEIAHALYYLNPSYKEEADKIVKHYKLDELMKPHLEKLGYGKNVLLDETQAYLGTSTYEEISQKYITTSDAPEFSGVLELNLNFYNNDGLLISDFLLPKSE